MVPPMERKENSRAKEDRKGKIHPANVTTASVTPPTTVSTWSLSKHSWSRSLVDSEFHDWSAVYSPWCFLVDPRCHFWSFFQFTILSSAKAKQAYSHPFILAQTSAWVNSFFFLSWGHCKKISLVSSSLQDSYSFLSLFFFLSLGRFQQYHQPSKGSWIKELSA